MLNFTKISDNLSGVIGFNQPLNPDYAIIDADNLASSSGLFITDNEFCKIELIYDSQDYSGISDEDFNDLLRQKVSSSIKSVCNAVFNERDFRERNLIYSNALNRAEIETLPIGFVGYRLISSCENNIAISISKVICEFNGTGDFTLLCFSTSQKEPLFTKDISITTDNQRVELNWVIDNTDTYKGEYYIGYVNNNLSISPFKRNYNNSSEINCFNDFDLYTVYVNTTDDTQIFDLRDIEGNALYCGLNFDITTYDDYTDLVISNKQLFANAILLDCQISCLTTYLASIRSNLNERNSDRLVNRVLAEIEGQDADGLAKVTGLRPQLFRGIAKLKKEISKLQEGYFGNGYVTDTLC